MSAPAIALLALLCVAVTVLSAAFIVLSRRIESVLTRVETWLAVPPLQAPGLQLGSHIHRFTALRQSGQLLSDLDLRGHVSVVLFMKADCVVCRSLAHQLSRKELDALGIGSTTYVIVRDEHERDALSLDPDLEIVFQEDGIVSWAFRSTATPQAFVVDENGIVAATGFPNSMSHLDALVTHARESPSRPVRAAAGH